VHQALLEDFCQYKTYGRAIGNRMTNEYSNNMTKKRFKVNEPEGHHCDRVRFLGRKKP